MSQESPASFRDREVFDLIAQEDRRQAECLTLIASENHCSPAVRAATGSLLTDKYAEGYPGRRYYGGCEIADQIETLAIERAKELFGAEHANVQAHSGTQANLGAYLSVLEPGDKLLGMALNAGGHLSHGFSRSHSGILFDVARYGIDKETGLIDYDAVEQKALDHQPKIVVAGFSSYPRTLDWKRMRAIADKVGAYFLADIAHPAGLIAAGVLDSPVGIADFVTMTTHKTLRGPRGGMILCKAELAKKLDSSVFPGGQGGPFLHSIAGKAVAFGEALQPEFKIYGQQVLDNARVLGEALLGHGFQIVTGGTENHLVMVDLRPKGLTGRQAENLCLQAGLVVNKNLIPGDPQKAMETSGLRLGTAAPTTRGMTQDGMIEIAGLLDRLITGGESEIATVHARVRELAAAHPLPA